MIRSKTIVKREDGPTSVLPGRPGSTWQIQALSTPIRWVSPEGVLTEEVATLYHPGEAAYVALRRDGELIIQKEDAWMRTLLAG